MKQPKIDFLQAIVWREDDDFVAQCLNVDVASFGSSKKEALNNLKEALQLYFEDESRFADVNQPELVRLKLNNA
ncbi:type II toxin-antitoxin system HicB family antitoxin [Candidatus Berkelbacteria bacterium]|nr:type II toxin-antitoxin system HicB family antitoxin [Candidatus Berkelbacteria bacterium]